MRLRARSVFLPHMLGSGAGRHMSLFPSSEPIVATVGLNAILARTSELGFAPARAGNRFVSVVLRS